MQEKESRIVYINEELSSLKADYRELEFQNSRLTSENQSLRKHLDDRESALSQTTQQLRNLQPRLEDIEPEFNRLKSEKEEWHRCKDEYIHEIDMMKPAYLGLKELNKDLASVPVLSMHMNSPSKSVSFSQSKGKVYIFL